MTTPRQLVEIMAEILNVSEPTVVVHDRNLAAAQLRSMAGRGRAAAIVTAEDAANLLVAVAASVSVKDSAIAVRHYGNNLRVVHPFLSGIRRYDRLPIPHSFQHALCTLIEAAALEEIDSERFINIAFLGPFPRAEIELKSKDTVTKVSYVTSSRKGGVEQHNRLVTGDLQRMTTVTQNTIFRLGKAIGSVS